jgi:hypothetical protein
MTTSIMLNDSSAGAPLREIAALDAATLPTRHPKPAASAREVCLGAGTARQKRRTAPSWVVVGAALAIALSIAAVAFRFPTVSISTQGATDRNAGP